VVLALNSLNIGAISGKEACCAKECVIPVQNGDILLSLLDLNGLKLRLQSKP